VDGKPSPEIKWFKDWHPIVESSRVKLIHEDAGTCALIISNPMSSDTGLYSCTATNQAGKVSSSATLTVEVDEFEVELQNGVLNVVFEEPAEARFVVSPNAPVRQIWVSAMAKSYKLSWSSELGGFALDGETLPKLLDRLARMQLGATS